MIISELKKIIYVSSISNYKGITTFRQSYFYTNNMNAEKFKNEIVNKLMEHNIKFELVDYYDYWAPFKGGAPISKQSHWCVKLKIL